MGKDVLKFLTPAAQNGTVTLDDEGIVRFRPALPAAPARPARPKRSKNKDVRTREYLTHGEIEQLIKAAAKNRNPHRDRTLIEVASRHGLRVSELIDLRWDQVDFNRAVMHIRRAKKGSPATHPINGRELRMLRQLKREQNPASVFMFTSERNAPFSARGVFKLVAQLGVAAKLPFPVHPHMLRHACGYKLANDGVDTRTIQGYLGHKNIQHTVRYTELSPARFKNLWDD
jgi:integrase